MIQISWWRIQSAWIKLPEQVGGNSSTQNPLETSESSSKRKNKSFLELLASASESASRLPSILDHHSRSFLQPFDPSPSVSPWTRGSASGEKGCAVLAEVEKGLAVWCSPSVSARTLWSVPAGLRNQAQPDRERRQRTSEPQTLGSWPWGLTPRSTDRKHWT